MVKEPHYKLQLAFKLYPLQQEIVDHLNGVARNPEGDEYRFLMAVFGRQSGKSFFCKITALDWAVNRAKRVMWVAPSIPTARVHWHDIVALVEKSGLKVKRISHSTKEIQFYGGGYIAIRSAVQPNNLRGATVDLLILDEAAFFPNGEYVWSQVCQPMVSASRGKVLMASTPNGRNWFYTLYSRGQDDADLYYKSWRAPSAASPYQDHKLLEDLKRTLPAKKWLEEYEAEFLADAGGVFAGVEEASTAPFLTRPIVGHSYVAGVDIGFVNDETVFTVIDEFTREQVYGEAWTNVGTIPTLRRLAALLDIWKPRVTMFEKNGLGETFFDLIRSVFSGQGADTALIETIFDPYQQDPTEGEDPSNFITVEPNMHYREIRIDGLGVIRGIHMNNEMKRAMVDALSADIEYQRIKLIDHNTEYGRKQVSQMSTYERKPTASGMAVTYSAQEGAHDDCIAALYLARRALPRPRAVKTTDKPLEVKKNPFRAGHIGLRWNRR